MNNNNLQTGGGKTSFSIEKAGQIDFFQNFSIDYENNRVLIDYTDGVWNGNLFEFKRHIDNLGEVLSQAIKYLSKMRIRGESVPANIILVSLNTKTAYLYHSKDYFDEIHKIYIGASSKNNKMFIAKPYDAKFDYSKTQDTIELQKALRQNDFIPIRIDEDSIVGWAERYYRENPKSSKGDFIGDDMGQVRIIGEIRNPKHFSGLIIPYTGKTNEKFKYLMDKLNDRLQKKDLGAFYTPIPYCEKAAELVRIAISRVPKGYDYVIIDRCAGTGNLESVLNEDELSHCILSTYEYYEYKVLCERLGDKVRFIIPPTESLVEYKQGLVMNANALTREYIENESIQEYIKDDKCTIILFENPPYHDSSSITFTDESKSRAITRRNDSYVKSEFKKDIRKLNEQRGAAREVLNLFIWSAFKYYLRQPTDSYIVFAPVKYFKSIWLVKKEFIKGFAFNRKHFHASPSLTSCVLWGNTDADNNEWILETYDIANNELSRIDDLVVKKIYNGIAEYNDRRKFRDDIVSNIVCLPNGYQKTDWFHRKRIAINNSNIIAYMVTIGNSIDAKHRYLTRMPYYVGIEQSFGYYLRRDNYLNKLPIFCAKLYPQDEWYETDVYFNTSDKGNMYECDSYLLKSCLIYVCLSYDNKCRSIIGTNGVIYQNELCFDGNSVAALDLVQMNLDESDKEIISIWENVLSIAKSKDEYDSRLRYGIWQIDTDINLSWKDEFGDRIYKYPELNGYILALKNRLKQYYKEKICNLLFKYELIK